MQPSGTRETARLNVIYEDQDLLAVNKPADLVCHPTKGDVYSSLISRVRLYLGAEVPAQLINRLDRETSGVTLISKNLQAAREIRRLWEARQIDKIYLAIVHGHVPDDQRTICEPLGPDRASKVAIKDCVRIDGAAAETRCVVLRRFFREIAGSAGPVAFTLLEARPLTGRKHQIRIHLAHIGHPIVGDKIYGGEEDAYLALVERRLTEAQRQRLILPCHALHAAELRFSWRGSEWHFCADAEPWFTAFSL